MLNFLKNIKKKQVRVRFAPSPTGSLHVGGARTALFNFIFAKKYQGRFILRVEDTDQERNQESYLKEQLETLHWLGLHWDEGPKLNSPLEYFGDFGPYRQTHRINIYKKYAASLLEQGKAYYCFLTDQEIDEMKSKSLKSHQPMRIQSPYRDWSLHQSLEKIKQGHKATIRFKMPKSRVHYKIQDQVRGAVSFPTDMVGDFIILRSNLVPVYNFCCAIDDMLMKITHVFRAEEHLSNTLRQILIIKSLGFEEPQYGHLSLILNSDRKKLSKRDGSLSCLEYKKEGYLPEALNNFFALLGWSPKNQQEIFNPKELIQNFSETRLNSAGAVFDQNKLKWINAQHLRKMKSDQFWKKIKPFLAQEEVDLPKDDSWKKQAFESLKSSFSNLREASSIFKLLSKDDYKIEAKAYKIKEWEKSKSVLKNWQSLLAENKKEYLSLEDFNYIKKQIQSITQAQGKFLFMPLRVAAIGRLHGLELNEAVPLIKKEILLQRVKQVLENLF